MQLQTDRLLLRDVSITDLLLVHTLHSLPATDEFNTSGIPEDIHATEALLRQWIAQMETSPRVSYIFSVELATTGQFIGLIGLKIGKLHYRIAEVWYKTDPSYWRLGYTTEALVRVLDFGFGTLRLHRIEAGCATANTASIRVLEKAGMVREGHKKKILPIRGEWVDNYIYAILEK